MKQLLIFASIGLCLTSTCIAQAPASSPEIDVEKRDSAEVVHASALDELTWMVGSTQTCLFTLKADIAGLSIMNEHRRMLRDVGSQTSQNQSDLVLIGRD